MIYRTFLFSLFILLFSVELKGQTGLKFGFEYSEDFNQELFSEVSIRQPNGETNQLYFDSLNAFDSYEKNFFQFTGDHVLIVIFKHDSPKQEVLKHTFSVDLDELMIELDVSFRMGRKWVRDNSSHTSHGDVAKGYISIHKYYESLEGVEVQPSNLEPKDYYRGPYFTITNKSDKTIYGEFLPGYFWGRLYSLNEDLDKTNKLGFSIDLNFTRKEPLLPDSSRIATVGSFGVSNQLETGSYRFELLYTIDGRNHSFKKLEDRNNFEWWNSYADFYTISYDFEQ